MYHMLKFCFRFSLNITSLCVLRCDCFISLLKFKLSVLISFFHPSYLFAAFFLCKLLQVLELARKSVMKNEQKLKCTNSIKLPAKTQLSVTCLLETVSTGGTCNVSNAWSSTKYIYICLYGCADKLGRD